MHFSWGWSARWSPGWLSGWPTDQHPRRGLGVGGVVGGMTVGLVFTGMRAGGEACIMHFVLRLWLIRNGSTAWNYVKFLDYAADRILLRKVGGGYMFIHRMLLEYFAARYVSLRHFPRPRSFRRQRPPNKQPPCCCLISSQLSLMSVQGMRHDAVGPIDRVLDGQDLHLLPPRLCPDRA